MSRSTLSILGSGWLGLPLSLHLQSRGYAVRVSTSRLARLAELCEHGLESHVVDIHDLNDRVSVFLQADILICNITTKDIVAYQNLVRCIEHSPVKRVLFVSSTSVYPNTNKMVAESESLEDSDSPLVEIENLFVNSQSFDSTILRFGGLVGYSRNPARFFQPGRPMRDPDAYVNLIHRDDCINIIERIVAKDIWGEVLNACADSHPKKRDFYTSVARQSGYALPEFLEPEAGQTGYKIIDNQKIKDLLEYEFQHADLMKIDFQQ